MVKRWGPIIILAALMVSSSSSQIEKRKPGMVLGSRRLVLGMDKAAVLEDLRSDYGVTRITDDSWIITDKQGDTIVLFKEDSLSGISRSVDQCSSPECESALTAFVIALKSISTGPGTVNVVIEPDSITANSKSMGIKFIAFDRDELAQRAVTISIADMSFEDGGSLHVVTMQESLSKLYEAR